MTPPSPADELGFDDAFLRRLERLALRGRRALGAAGGRPGARRIPAADFIDHRAYSPGDDQRHIDWPAAARSDALFVKVGRAPQAADVRLLVDASPSMAVDPTKWRLARQLAAALGWLSLARGDRVGLSSFPAEGGAGAWGPASGGASGAALLAHVASIAPCDCGGTALIPAVRASVGSSPTGGLLVLVSDLWLSDDFEAALALAPPPRWESLVLHVLSRDELAPELDGVVTLADAETDESLRYTIDAVVRDAYRAALAARLERVGGAAARRGARHALVPADWPLERAVIPFLQRRMVLGR